MVSSTDISTFTLLDRPHYCLLCLAFFGVGGQVIKYVV